MKVVLFGSSGLLGNAFAPLLEENERIELFSPTSSELNLLDEGSIESYLGSVAPDLVVNCAGYTRVDEAEVSREACEILNVGVVEAILDARVPVITFSSDYVFDVPMGIEIPEDQPQNPINVYGKCKAKAEKLLEESGQEFWNVRTSWLFGSGSENFVTKILAAAQGQTPLRVIGDQVGRPTYAPDLAQWVYQYLILKKQPSGHYHLQGGGEPVSWAGFAEYFLHGSKPVRHLKSDEWVCHALRPKNNVLKNTKLPPMRDWKEAVDEYLTLLSI